MRIKRVISVVLISLLVSLFQGMPLANAATVPVNPSSISVSDGPTPNTLSASITAPNDGGSPITNYQYSFDEVTWIDYSPATGPGNATLIIDTSTRVFQLTNLYFKAVNAIGASKSSWDVTASSRGRITVASGGLDGLPFVYLNSAPSGSAMSGSTLGNGLTVLGKPNATVTRQWQSCTSSSDLTTCTDIPGATSSTYVLTDNEVGKFIRTTRTGTNSIGSITGYSPLTSAVSALADVTAPSVSNVNSSTINGSYKSSDSISIQVTFSENVTVTGTPRITLETGSTDRAVSYASGSGTNTLTFTYTVQAGDTSNDLDYVATTSLALNGGTIKDAAGNNAVLTLASPGASNSLSANKAIVIDTTAPTQTISSIDISVDSGSSDTDFLTATALQTITGTLSANLAASESLWGSVNGGVSYTNISSSVTGTAISWAGATLSGTSSIKIEVRDAAGNVGTIATQSYELDTNAPTQTIGSIDISADSGSSATDFITATASQTITGTLSAILGANESLWGSVDGGMNYTDVSSSVSGTAISWLNATLSGSSSIKFQVRNTAGASGTVATQVYVLDTTAPTPTVATSSVTTASGVTVRSSEIGTAYLVKSTIVVNSFSDIENAANDNYNEVAISAANSDTVMSTAGLVTGDYKLYVVDALGNLSVASASNTVTVAVATAPSVASTAAPTGTTTFGSTLTNAVTFTGVPTPTQFGYQWKSCTSATDTATACTDISGATNSSFIANAVDLVGKFIRVLVTAINGISPNGSALSSPTAAITPVAPGVPIVGTPTRGDLQINVPVTAPASNGGSTILKYQFSTDGGATWSDRTDTATVSSPIVIKFLSTDGTTPIVAGTTYPVQIRAVNSASNPNGAGSASVSVTAAAAPSAPTAVSATASGQTTATVSFTAPADTGGTAISSYTVTSSPGGVTASGSSSPITVTGLNSGTTYTFSVVANNGAVNSVVSAPSSPITTLSPPPPPPPPVCDAACVAAAAKVIADKMASDNAAKAAAEKVSVDKRAAEAAAKTAVDKAAAAVVAKAAADAAAVQAAVVAKAAADAQAVAVEAANKAAEALKSATTSAAAKAAAKVTATRAATTAANKVRAAAAAAKVAATAKTTASNASKQVDIALGALNSKTAAATSAAQANAIAAAAKAAANKAAKSAADQAAAAKTASNNANREASLAAARIVTEQNKAATAATEAKSATDAALKATEEKIAAATEAQKGAEAVVNALNEKIALAEASVNAKDITERAAIDKKIEEITVKVAEAQRVADTANIRAEAAIAAQEIAQTAAAVAAKQAEVQAAEVATVKAESIAKIAAATKAAADASLAAKVAAEAKAAAAKVPARAVIATKPSTTTSKNSAKATITGLKPGQKVKVTVNVKGK